MRSNRFLALTLLTLSLFGLSCRSKKAAGPAQVGPFPKAPVVLISIDTLRSDHLPAYGYSKVETPAIDALVKHGVLFERAYSHIPLTLPSHVTILTGLLPTETGIRDNVGYHFDSAKFPYLPRLLGADGYTTGGAVSAFVLRGETGLEHGFDFYQSAIEVRVNSSLGRSQRPGTETLAVAEPWLEKASSGTKPVFFFFHIYEPHRPYNPPEPFLSRYGKTYDGEIASADAIIGDLVAELKKLNLYDKAIVVLLSDHGEGLDEHGEQEHGILLYREDIQVPLIIKLPHNQLAGTKVSAPAELSDISPTILRLVGLTPSKNENGRDLFTLDRPGAEPRDIYSETYYPRIHMGWSQLTSMIRGDYQLIWGPDPELYDLKTDPGETDNLIHQKVRISSSMRHALRPYLTPLAAPSQESEGTTRKLAALGYLSGAATVKTTSGPLPDPKSRIGTLNDFGKAMHFYSEQKFAQAVPLFRKLVKENPDMLDAWDNLGSSLQRLGRRNEALAAFKQAMKVSGGAPYVALGTASLLLDMGRYDEARKHAELGVTSSPSVAHNLLAQIALDEGHLDEAEKQAHLAIAAAASRIGPLITLATIQQKQGHLKEALSTITQAENYLVEKGGAHVDFPGLFMLKGDLLARSGDGSGAEAAFKREIKDYPASTRGYSRLAALYAAEGRGQDAVDVLHQMVETNPESPAAYGEAVKGLKMLGDPRSAAGLLNMAMQRFPDSRLLRDLAKKE